MQIEVPKIYCLLFGGFIYINIEKTIWRSVDVYHDVAIDCREMDYFRDGIGDETSSNPAFHVENIGGRKETRIWYPVYCGSYND